MGQQLIEAGEYIRRVRLCLFEVGFRDVQIDHVGWAENGLPKLRTFQTVPVELAYMAARLAVIQDLPDVPAPCYGCFHLTFETQQVNEDESAAAKCRQGQCVTGGPDWPSHEELLGADRTEGLEIHADVA
jgi:hypothetical protein